MLSAGIQIPDTETIYGQDNKSILQSMIRKLMKGTLRIETGLWKERTRSRRRAKSNASKRTDQDPEIENRIRRAKTKRVIAKRTDNQEGSHVREKTGNDHIHLSHHLRSKVLVPNHRQVVTIKGSKGRLKRSYNE